jgi:ABC-type multidrug transport system permease subunit
MNRANLYTVVVSAFVAIVNTVVMQLIRFWYGFEAMFVYGVAFLMVCAAVIFYVIRKTKSDDWETS